MNRKYWFYKYHKNNKHLKDLLIANALHCSSKEALNDPYDLVIHFSEDYVKDIVSNNVYNINGDFIWNNLIDIVDPLLPLIDETFNNWDAEKKVKYIFKSDRNQIIFSDVIIQFLKKKVLSFSKQVRLNKETLMWAHYSGFDGVRISFSIPPFFAGRFEQYCMEKVKYYRKRFIVNTDSDLDKALLVKNFNWLYENEYRIVTDDEDKLGFDKELLKEIVFGNLMSDNDKFTLIKLCHAMGYKCKFYHLIVAPGGLKSSLISNKLIKEIVNNEQSYFSSKISYFK